MIRVAVGLAALFIAGRAAAAPAPDFATLVTNCGDSDPAIANAACSAIIAAGDSMGAMRFIALSRRAQADFEFRNTDQTIADASAALAINPLSGQNYTVRGRAYLAKNDYQPAIADEIKAISLLQEDALAYFALGAAEAQSGRFRPAIDAETRAIALAPSYTNAFVYRAEAEAAMGNRAAQLADLTAALVVDPDNEAAYADRAELYRRLNRNDLALADLRAARDRHPRNPYSALALAEGLGEFGQRREAIALLTALLTQDPPPDLIPFIYRARGFDYSKMGAPAQAVSDLDTALRLAPKLYGLYVTRAQIYRDQKNYAAALADDRTVIALAPWLTYGYVGAALTFEVQKDYAHALPFAEKALAIAPGDASRWNAVCWDLAHTKNLQRALTDCRKAVSPDRSAKDIWDSLGYVYLMRHDDRLAIRYYSKALAIDPALASSLYGRALAERGLEEARQAAADRAAAIKSEPDIVTSFGA
jgi:tetratricopeptide (TPR) repeat protein